MTTPHARGAVPVDDRCRAGDGLWSLGGVTGVSLFTHVAMYPGRVAADNILGRDRAARWAPAEPGYARAFQVCWRCSPAAMPRSDGLPGSA